MLDTAPTPGSLRTMENRASLLSFSGENAPAQLRFAWDRLEKIPLGRRIFSRTIGKLAPYTGSIPATVLTLERGRSTVRLEDRPKVRNHLRCVHAVALVNLAELAGNVALAYSMPGDARFIVAGISIDYVKKARGPILAEGRCPEIPNNERAEYAVHVTMRDRGGDVVAKATLRTLVGPQRA
jgi:acyl-coenzyme A thioesterase PaaI-like protein